MLYVGFVDVFQPEVFDQVRNVDKSSLHISRQRLKFRIDGRTQGLNDPWHLVGA